MHVIANISLQLPTSLCSVSITAIANYFITITVSLDHQHKILVCSYYSCEHSY